MITRSQAVVALAAVLAWSTPALAQSFFDEFDDAAAEFASSSADWQPIWSGDQWNTTLNPGGLSPNEDAEGPGAFGDPPDVFDNGIVAGEASWRDYGVEVQFEVADDDALGLIIRYTDPSSYYAVVFARDLMPTADGSVESVFGPAARLFRVTDAGAEQLLSPPPMIAYSATTGQPQRLRVEVAGDTITAWLSTGSELIDTDAPPAFTYTDEDADAPASGLAGVYAFAMDSDVPGTFFDSFRVEPLDSDDDGRSNDAELAAGTDPYDGDSDDDGVPDGEEFAWLDDPDGDSLINGLDWDSDDDGLPDGLELGYDTPHPDTDTDAGHFTPDEDPSTTTNPTLADTDSGGVDDGEEDLNGNGEFEPWDGETDPLNGDDDGEYPDAGADADTDADTDGDADGDGGADAAPPQTDAGAARLFGGPNCNCRSTGLTARLGGPLQALWTALLTSL